MEMGDADLELLARYSRNHAEDAFAEIVRRHVDLVYSAALRQVRSPQLAEEVAQSAFIKLARHARRLAPATVLSAWLYQVTRREAIDVVRREARRQLRERIATEITAMNAAPDDWTCIKPLLDEAMAALEDTDRTAVLLRYFENKSLREVGQTLGTSEDAAQKRVSRAVERLREFFVKRGVTVGASGLVAVISANAVQAAPVGLAVGISTVAALAGSAIQASTAIAATKAIAMTTLQKTLVAAALVAAAGTAVYENRQAAHLQQSVQSLQAEQVALTGQVAQLRQQNEDTSNRLSVLQQQNEQLRATAAEVPRLRGEVARLQSRERQLAQSRPAAQEASDPFAQSVLALTQKAAELNQQLERMPEKNIPELQFLKENDWLDAARAADLQSDEGIRRALSNLRSLAKGRFASVAAGALDKYIHENSGELPAELAQLSPYFDEPVSDAILQRYKILRTGNVRDLPKDAFVISEKAPVDRDYDSHLYIGPGRTASWATGKGEVGDPDPDWTKR